MKFATLGKYWGNKEENNMLSQNNLTKDKMIQWLKRYAYVIVAAVLLVAFAVIVSVVLLTGGKEDKVPTDGVATSFYSPVLNFTVGKDYVGDALIYNATLKQWEAHKSVDLLVAEGTNVYACLDGTVASITESYLSGTTIEVSHNNGLITKYSSLSKDVSVKVGDSIKSGQKLGVASTCANSSDLGTHLRLQVLKDGKAVDPNLYLELGNK